MHALYEGDVDKAGMGLFASSQEAYFPGRKVQKCRHFFLPLLQKKPAMDKNQRIYLSTRDDPGSDNCFAEGRWSRKHSVFMSEYRLRRLFLVRAQSSPEGNVYGVSGKPLVQQFNPDIMEGEKILKVF